MAKEKTIKIEGSIKNPNKLMTKAEFDKLVKKGDKKKSSKKK